MNFALNSDKCEYCDQFGYQHLLNFLDIMGKFTVSIPEWQGHWKDGRLLSVAPEELQTLVLGFPTAVSFGMLIWFKSLHARPNRYELPKQVPNGLEAGAGERSRLNTFLPWFSMHFIKFTNHHGLEA